MRPARPEKKKQERTQNEKVDREVGFAFFAMNDYTSKSTVVKPLKIGESGIILYLTKKCMNRKVSAQK